MNIIFMPLSVFEGMAGSRRLNNYLDFLLSCDDINIFNMIFKRSFLDSHIPKNHKVKVFLIRNRVLTYPLSLIQALFILWKIHNREGKNILYYYGYPDISNIIFIVGAKILGFKIIFDIVEDRFQIEVYNSFLNKIRIISSKFIFKNSGKIIDGFICISDHLSERIRNIFPSKKSILNIPITINSKYFNSFRKANNEKFVKIFYGGSFGIKDGLVYLLNAFEELASIYDIKLYISGKGSVNDERTLNNLISMNKFKNKIIRLGYLSYLEYINVLCNSDINCMTRTNTGYSNAGFPFKLGEMLASGNAVIATLVGDVSKYLDQNSAVLINPDSVEEIKRSLVLLINNSNLRLRIGEDGKKIALKNFDSTHHSKRLCDFLLKI